MCWADSLAAVDLMEQALPEGSRLGVLVELGAEDGRTGTRTEAEALAIAERVAASSVLTLRGVSGYEGALGHDRSEAALEAVRTYCERLAALGASVRDLVEGTAWITAGGSAYPDLVAAAIAGVPGTHAVLRSGGVHRPRQRLLPGHSPLDRDRGLPEREALLPAMHAYARVVSQPEPGLALLDAGKRDVPFDEGLPVPLAVADSLGGAERPLRAEVTALDERPAHLPALGGRAAGRDRRRGDARALPARAPPSTSGG